MRFSKPKKITSKNIKKEKSEPGLYVILDKNKKRLYTGSSKNLQHRMQAILYGRADYEKGKLNENNKVKLRKKAVFYRTSYMEISKARKTEKNLKKELKYNNK